MDLLQQINEAAKTYVPPEKPLVEMHPMTKMMLKAMDPERSRAYNAKESKEKKPAKKKSLSDYLDLSKPAQPAIKGH